METTIVEQDKELGAATPAPPRVMPPPPKSSARKLVIFVVLLVLASVGGYLWISSLNRVSTDDAQVDGHIVPISPKIYGKVLEVLVDDNQQVKQGQVLVHIDPQDYQAKLDQAQAAAAVAQLAAARADYDQAQVEAERAATADIAVARANVETAQATADHAQADLNRMKTLVDKEEISRLEYDSYASSTRVSLSQLQAAKDKLGSVIKDSETKKAALLSAQARIAQAEAGILQAKATQRQVPVRVADASSATASIGQAHANLEAAKLDLSYTTIVAPVDGVVTRKSVEVGQVVQQGQGLLMLVPLQNVWVTANFKETQLADVRDGQRAEVKADLSGKTYPGHVDSLAAATGTRMSLMPPENATGNYVKVVQRIPVKIVLDPIPGGNQVLRPGMNIEATIFTK